MLPEEYQHQTEWKLAAQGAYDFVDFGCSNGDSIELAQFLFEGRRGLGVDLDIAKVEATRARGLEALNADITNLDALENACRFVICHHFLEHVPNINLARACIRSACRLARDFVFIKQPNFDSDPYLLSHGLKLYWSDWGCHPNKMTTFDFVRILLPMQKRSDIHRFIIFNVSQITDSSDPAIHSIYSPLDSQQWDSNHHPEKPEMSLDGVYREVVALILIDDDPSLEQIIRRTPKTELVFDSRTQ